ncbi:hypothetical protein HYALB_00013393 [Hymenoscyphus albidus]|uniref:Uncharacterized protein n=1 Tax=Hymenoscyphus albidus TaxID=595503 RepID=A0A9N9PZ29_9HELO|nr:hypothetical protein HYALB_00013393 [Hymenoscyphus albidus]
MSEEQNKKVWNGGNLFGGGVMASAKRGLWPVLSEGMARASIMGSNPHTYRDQVDRLEQGGVNTIGKEHFTSLYSPARKLAFTPKNIKAGFAEALLTTINNEAKVRRSTKSLVLGRAKVISYEDLKEARAKRAKKDATKEAKKNKGKAKGKRGWKCKNATPEADEVEVDKAEADKANAVKTKRGRKRNSTMLEVDTLEPKVKVARISNAPELARGLVAPAQMSVIQVTLDSLRAPMARMW